MAEHERDSGDLRLRPFDPNDEQAARAAHGELVGEGFDFLYYPELPWAEQLQLIADEGAGINLQPNRVQSSFLAAVVGPDLVGRCSIRHQLNDFLFEFGGHIGYAVRPGFRRRGYATAILAAALRHCAQLGIDEVLVTCDDDNVGSMRVIESNGGVLEDLRSPGPAVTAKRRYWLRA